MRNFKFQKWLSISFMVIFAIFTMAALIGHYFLEKNIKPVRAGSADNVSGFAWSANIGYISFNSTNCDVDDNGFIDSGDCGGANDPTTPVVDYGVKIDKISGDFSGYAWSPTVGWISFNRGDTGNPPSDDPGTGSGPIAKLNLSTGAINGWGKILSLGDNGWLRFNHGKANEATINIGSGEFSGWAWNEGAGGMGVGWVSFNSNNAGSLGGDYKVIADVNAPPSIGSVEILKNGNPLGTDVINPGDSLGFRVDWSDAIVGPNGLSIYVCTSNAFTAGTVGTAGCVQGTWASNIADAGNQNLIPKTTATNPSVSPGDVLNLYTVTGGTNNYYVYACDDFGKCTPTPLSGNFVVNTPPEALNLTAPNWSHDQACDDTNGANAELRAHLKWTYSDADGDISSAYQITVRDSLGNQLFTTNKCTASGGDCKDTCLGKASGSSCDYELKPNTWFKWGTAYQWEVTVWDAHDAPSTVTVYNSATDTDNDDSNNYTFTTYKHKFPDVDFDWFVPDPSASEEVLFSDKSNYYKDDNTQSSAGSCGTGFGPCSWTWSKVDPTADIDIDSPNNQQTIIKFNNTTDSAQINLEACDKDSYCCNLDKGPASVKEKLPGWKEGSN